MADPVFALSPISARGSLPTEADYDAIREAFMETARGRWFLNEYAKRNRNADTNLVLDAVSRLEATLAAQKQEQQRDRTPEIIAAIHALVIEARSEAAVLISVRDAPDADSPALKGVRVLREMAWTLRESGSDGRIPDLLGKQADAIEEGLKAAIDDTARDHLLSVFDRLAGDIEALSQGTSAAAQPQASAVANPQPVQETAATASEASVAETAALDDPQAAELQAVAEAMAADDGAEVVTEPEAQAELSTPPASVAAASGTSPRPDLTPAGYVTIEAVSDEAMEVTWDEPEADVPDEVADTIAAVNVLQPAPATAAPDPVAPAPPPEPMLASAASTERMAALEAAIMAQAEQPSARLQPESEATATLAKPAGISLGAALLEKGIVARPDAPRGDPLAPFKRMTQAERVAFFS